MQDFRITKAYLYRVGIGWFLAENHIQGDTVFFPVPMNNVNDFLKTSIIQVDSDTEDFVLNLSFDTQSSATTFFSSNKGIRGVLEYLRAKNVRMNLKNGEKREGLIVGYEHSCEEDDCEEDMTKGIIVTLYNSATNSLDFIRARDIQSIFPIDEKQREQFIERLLMASGMDDQQKELMLKIQFKSQTEKDLKIHFLSEIPAWKITYRAILLATKENGSKTQQLVLETWGIVDNNTKIDWVNCELVLSTVMPISFKYNLSTPIVIERPTIELETQLGVSPVVPETFVDFEEEEPYLTAEPTHPSLKKRARPMSMSRGPEIMPAPSPAKPQAKIAKDTFGESVIFKLSQPVTIKKGQSAMVPLSTETIEGRKILLFNQEAHEIHPVQVLDIKNTLKYALDKGPISVFEGFQFLGEGLIPRLGLNEQYYLPFALDQDVILQHDSKARTKSLRFEVSGKYMYELTKRYETHTWEIENKASKEKTLIIELPKPNGYLLENPERTDQELNEVWRFTITIPAHKKKQLKKVISREIKNRNSLQNLSVKQLLDLIKNADIPEGNKQKIMRLAELKEMQGTLEENIQTLQDDLLKNTERREELLQALEVIKDNSSEKALRLKYLKEMEELDSSNKALKDKVSKARTELLKIEEEIKKELRELEL